MKYYHQTELDTCEVCTGYDGCLDGCICPTCFPRLYLGAGKDHRAGFINVDIHPFQGIDDVFDATEGRWPYPDNTFDLVFSQDFLEHINPMRKVHVINEIWRVLKVGGVMEHWIPNAGSRNDFGSPSHISHWNLQQFEHFNVASYRYQADREYEGFSGAFEQVVSEEVNFLEEYGRMIPQAIHVIYKKV